MRLQRALEIAQKVLKKLEPHCERISIAGSVRRMKYDVGDIEIVAIPSPSRVRVSAAIMTALLNLVGHVLSCSASFQSDQSNLQPSSRCALSGSPDPHTPTIP